MYSSSSSRVLINDVSFGDFRTSKLSISTTNKQQQQQQQQQQQHIDINNSPISDIDSEHDNDSSDTSTNTLSRSISMLSISSQSSNDDDMNENDDDMDMSASSCSDTDDDVIEPLHTPQYSVPHVCHQYHTPTATTTTTTTTKQTTSKPWSGCQACDHPYLNRICTQSHLLQLAIDSCLPSTPTTSSTTHTCTSSCTHHINHIHYTRPAYLSLVTLNPAGFIRPTLVETKDDIESTMLGQRRLIQKNEMNGSGSETPVMSQRRTSVFTFDRTATVASIQQTTTAPHQTPRVSKRASISNIHIPVSISTSSSSFIPTLPSIHSSTSSPIQSSSELAITVEIPHVPISPCVFPRQQPCISTSPSLITRTTSCASLARVEEGCATMMSPPLSSSRLMPKWQQPNKKPQQHFVLPPIKQQKFHGVLPTTTTTHASPPSLPSTWTQPKVMGLYLGYLVLNAAFVMLLHH